MKFGRRRDDKPAFVFGWLVAAREAMEKWMLDHEPVTAVLMWDGEIVAEHPLATVVWYRGAWDAADVIFPILGEGEKWKYNRIGALDADGVLVWTAEVGTWRAHEGWQPKIEWPPEGMTVTLDLEVNRWP